MKAHEQPLINFLNNTQQFVIPIYQRKYSWSEEHCEKIWQDLIKIIDDDNLPYHFIGSFVRVENRFDTNDIPQQLVIDGQQRITTILLLIIAIIKNLDSENRKEELKETYLINRPWL